ncbi:MAG: ATP-binding protein, partial [Fimbriimonadaceae bacterium]
MSAQGRGFQVDTKLFRELGELLVGRDSTALAELVKNSYDADATEVTVFGMGLETNEGQIVIRDNGVGMTEDDFVTGFLRIASRYKTVDGQHLSALFKRRVTGAKGIGRLAAHKMSALLHIESMPHSSKNVSEGVIASIDWDKIEALSSLDEIPNSDAIIIRRVPLSPNYLPGTTLVLKRLRRKWTDREISRFVREVDTYQAPIDLLADPSRGVAPKTILGDISVGSLADVGGFRIELGGDFDVGESHGITRINRASWMIEIDSSATGIKYLISQLGESPALDQECYQRDFEVQPKQFPNAPAFKSRIFFRKGAAAWARDSIAVYLEGFRVFPYGEPGDDWMAFENRYAERQKKINLPEVLGGDLVLQHFMRFPARAFYGGVFLSVDANPDLKMLINREGFLANDCYGDLVKAVKLGVELLVRALSETHFEDDSEGDDNAIASGQNRGRKRASAGPTKRVQAENMLEVAATNARQAREKFSRGEIESASESLLAAADSADLALQLADGL